MRRNQSTQKQHTGMGSCKVGNKRTSKRKNAKDVHSAKVTGGFKGLEGSPERLPKDVEWLRVLTPPRTDISSMYGADDVEHHGDEDSDEEDELIKRYFSGLSSAGSSISWADDAMESEFTNQLRKLWDDIESVCAGGNRPENMSTAVYEECLQWSKAFPNPNLHRFSSGPQNDTGISPRESPHFDEGAGDEDAPFSSIVNFPRFSRMEVKGKVRDDASDHTVSILQANFRTLNCATPRPNIEKSTLYVNAWLSDCHNSYCVPANLDQNPSDSLQNSRAASPSTTILNSSNHLPSSSTAANNERRSKGRPSLNLVSNVGRSSYANYSRSHAKSIAEPHSENFFTSLALSNNENFAASSPGRRVQTSLDHTSPINTFGERKGMYAGSFAQLAEETEEEDRVSPDADNITEIVSRRSNVRVQRPISSRIRDHTITPIATGSTFASPLTFGNRHKFASNTISHQQINEGKLSDSSFRINSSNQFSLGVRDGKNSDSVTNSFSPASSLEMNSRMNRIRSGISTAREGYNSSLTHQSYNGRFRQNQQAIWSRHVEEDADLNGNVVTRSRFMSFARDALPLEELSG